MSRIQKNDIFSLDTWDFSEFKQRNNLTIGSRGKIDLYVGTLIPGDVSGFWEKYLLIIQSFLTKPLAKLPPEAPLVMKRANILEDREELDLMVIAASELLSWQLLYKFAEQRNFQVQCKSKSVTKSLEPGIAVRIALLKLCRAIYPGGYADNYRDWLHWFCCLWHEDFSTRRKLTDPPEGKRKSVNELRTLTFQYSESINPHDEIESPHHYRLVKTALDQKRGTESRKLWQQYIEALRSYTALLDSTDYHEWYISSTGITKQTRGRPAKNLSLEYRLGNDKKLKSN